MSKKTLFTDFDYDFNLIGISAYSKDYRLCWELNRLLNVDLKKEEDIILTSKKGDKMEFSMYFHQNTLTEKDLRLVKNKKEGRIIIPEQPKADYFLILYDFDTYEIKEIIEKLKKINVVLTAFQVEISTLKSKQNLLF